MPKINITPADVSEIDKDGYTNVEWLDGETGGDPYAQLEAEINQEELDAENANIEPEPERSAEDKARDKARAEQAHIDQKAQEEASSKKTFEYANKLAFFFKVKPFEEGEVQGLRFATKKVMPFYFKPRRRSPKSEATLIFGGAVLAIVGPRIFEYLFTPLDNRKAEYAKNVTPQPEQGGE